MVSYFFENTDFKLKNKTKIKNWLRFVAESEIFTLGNISVIFCSDNYILDINQRFLQHDYFTEILKGFYCFLFFFVKRCICAALTGHTPVTEMNTVFTSRIPRICICA